MKRFYDTPPPYMHTPNKKPYQWNNSYSRNSAPSYSPQSNPSAPGTSSAIPSTSFALKNGPPASQLSPSTPVRSSYYAHDYSNINSFIHNPPPSPVPAVNYFVQRSSYPRGQWRLPLPGGAVRVPTPTQRWYRPVPTPSAVLPISYTPRPNGQQPTRKKVKKKTLGQTVPARVIKREDAEAALKCELEYTMSSKQLVIRFPDPPIDRDTVLKFNPAIKKVHFQHPSIPRYCFIQLDESADTKAVINELRQVKFGMGNLRIELKHEANERRDRPEDIDPYVLFVGNISQHTPAETIKKLFQPGRVDIGPSQRVKNSRYALVKFVSAQDAIDVFKKTQGIVVENYSLNVRFRRLNGAVGLPGDKTKKAPDHPNETAPNKDKSNETNNQPSPSTTENSIDNLPAVVKKEEDDDYDYFEHPEPCDELDIKMKNEYYIEDAEYYVEQPEDYEFESDFFFSDYMNNYNGSANSSQNTNDSRLPQNSSISSSYLEKNNTTSIDTQDEMTDEEFARGLREMRRQHETKREVCTDETENDSLSQIHLSRFPSSPTALALNKSEIESNCDEFDTSQVKSEVDNDDYDMRTNDVTGSLLDVRSIKEDSDCESNVLKNNDLIVRIPRDKIYLNNVLSKETNDPKNDKPQEELTLRDDLNDEDGYDDATFARELKALLKNYNFNK